MIEELLAEINGLSYLPVDRKQLRRITPKYLEFLYKTAMNNKCFKTFKLFSLITQARLLEMNFEDDNYQDTLETMKQLSGEMVVNNKTYQRGYLLDLCKEPNFIIVLNVSQKKLDIWNIYDVNLPDSLETKFLSALSFNAGVMESVKY